MSDRGNGADISQMLAVLHELVAGQKEIRSTLGDHGRMLGDHGRMLADHSRMLGDHGRMLADHGHKLEDLRAVVLDHGRRLDERGRRLDDVAAGLSGLREAVTEYHAAVLGHGVLYSQLEERVRRIVRRLDLPPAAA